jgi:hypothetical protein
MTLKQRKMKTKKLEQYVLCSECKGSRRLAISKEMDPGKS